MEPFKNELSHTKARLIGAALKRAYPALSEAKFNRGLESSLAPLELKSRARFISERIEACLPFAPPEVFSILVQSLAREESDSVGLRGFLVWPLTEIVARRGLPHFAESMAALREMTQRFTAEFAIRAFLRHDLRHTLAQLHEWCADPDPHVRRLVSEGSRPLLPWGGNLPELLQAPYPTLVLLEKLHSDTSAYVRLSVANHLNDFSKHHPSLVLETLTRWLDANPNAPHFAKLARHACRTLLKAGHREAMEFHGYAPAHSLVLEVCELAEETVKMGESLGYRVIIRNTSKKPLKVMFDYAIHHRKANGSLSPKVFKGRTRELSPGEVWEISSRHSFKLVTTRVYHTGVQGFEPRINGKTFPRVDFLLTDSLFTK